MANFATADVLETCIAYGPQLRVPAGLDGRGVMLAIAAVESGGADIAFAGHDCGPRHEPAYDQGGHLATAPLQAALLTRYGRVAACSYGPWQMMFGNFRAATQDAIVASQESLQLYAADFVEWFNRYVIEVRRAGDLAQIGEVWNLGHVGPDPVYVERLERAYTAWQSQGA